MYKIVEASQTPMPKQAVKLGYPDHTYPDIVLVNTLSQQSYIPFNSILLRELLLNNKAAILKYAGVVVKDANEKEEKKELKKKDEPKIQEIKTEKKPEGDTGWK